LSPFLKPANSLAVILLTSFDDEAGPLAFGVVARGGTFGVAAMDSSDEIVG
jgi:hypothetical protein